MEEDRFTKLQWEPQFEPLFVERLGGYLQRDDIRGVRRSDTLEPIGQVGARFAFVPNAEFVDMVKAFESLGGKTDMLGTQRGGARVYSRITFDSF